MPRPRKERAFNIQKQNDQIIALQAQPYDPDSNWTTNKNNIHDSLNFFDKKYLGRNFNVRSSDNATANSEKQLRIAEINKQSGPVRLSFGDVDAARRRLNAIENKKIAEYRIKIRDNPPPPSSMTEEEMRADFEQKQAGGIPHVQRYRIAGEDGEESYIPKLDPNTGKYALFKKGENPKPYDVNEAHVFDRDGVTQILGTVKEAINDKHKMEMKDMTQNIKKEYESKLEQKETKIDELEEHNVNLRGRNGQLAGYRGMFMRGEVNEDQYHQLLNDDMQETGFVIGKRMNDPVLGGEIADLSDRSLRNEQLRDSINLIYSEFDPGNPEKASKLGPHWGIIQNHIDLNKKERAVMGEPIQVKGHDMKLPENGEIEEGIKYVSPMFQGALKQKIYHDEVIVPKIVKNEKRKEKGLEPLPLPPEIEMRPNQHGGEVQMQPQVVETSFEEPQSGEQTQMQLQAPVEAETTLDAPQETVPTPSQSVIDVNEAIRQESIASSQAPSQVQSQASSQRLGSASQSGYSERSDSLSTLASTQISEPESQLSEASASSTRSSARSSAQSTEEEEEEQEEAEEEQEEAEEAEEAEEEEGDQPRSFVSDSRSTLDSYDSLESGLSQQINENPKPQGSLNYNQIELERKIEKVPWTQSDIDFTNINPMMFDSTNSLPTLRQPSSFYDKIAFNSAKKALRNSTQQDRAITNNLATQTSRPVSVIDLANRNSIQGKQILNNAPTESNEMYRRRMLEENRNYNRKIYAENRKYQSAKFESQRKDRAKRELMEYNRWAQGEAAAKIHDQNRMLGNQQYRFDKMLQNDNAEFRQFENDTALLNTGLQNNNPISTAVNTGLYSKVLQKQLVDNSFGLQAAHPFGINQ